MVKLNRRQERIWALQILYGLDFNRWNSGKKQRTGG